MLIPHFKHFLFLHAPAQVLSVHLQLSILPQGFLSKHNPQSISLCICWLETVFHLYAQQEDSVWIVSFAMTQGLGHIPHLRPSSHYPVDDIVWWVASLVSPVSPLGVAQSAIGKRSPQLVELILLSGKLSDVVSCGAYGGKRWPVCQGWYV